MSQKKKLDPLIRKWRQIDAAAGWIDMIRAIVLVAESIEAKKPSRKRLSAKALWQGLREPYSGDDSDSKKRVELHGCLENSRMLIAHAAQAGAIRVRALVEYGIGTDAPREPRTEFLGPEWFALYFSSERKLSIDATFGGDWWQRSAWFSDDGMNIRIDSVWPNRGIAPTSAKHKFTALASNVQVEWESLKSVFKVRDGRQSQSDIASFREAGPGAPFRHNWLSAATAALRHVQETGKPFRKKAALVKFIQQSLSEIDGGAGGPSTSQTHEFVARFWPPKKDDGG